MAPPRASPRGRHRGEGRGFNAPTMRVVEFLRHPEEPASGLTGWVRCPHAFCLTVCPTATAKPQEYMLFQPCSRFASLSQDRTAPYAMSRTTEGWPRALSADASSIPHRKPSAVRRFLYGRRGVGRRCPLPLPSGWRAYRRRPVVCASLRVLTGSFRTLNRDQHEHRPHATPHRCGGTSHAASRPVVVTYQQAAPVACAVTRCCLYHPMGERYLVTGSSE